MRAAIIAVTGPCVCRVMPQLAGISSEQLSRQDAQKAVSRSARQGR